MSELGFNVHLDTDFDSAVARVTDALKQEGFGVLTEIDVRETMKKKLDVDFRPYKILGACNPPFAHRVLSATPEVGLLLPCNVTVAANEAGGTDVAIIDPLVMFQVVNDDAVKPIAHEVREKLLRVAASLKN